MNKFSEFNIKVTEKGFQGDKIKISKIIDKEIEVHQYKITDSKVFRDRDTGKCLQLQISINGQMHVVFTGASGLIEQIQKVPESGFPFTTVIIEENERYKFT